MSATSSMNGGGIRNNDFKLTSLPFHQYHKQTYEAFGSPKNASFSNGGTSNTPSKSGSSKNRSFITSNAAAKFEKE